ncbi:MAG: rod shape-determining protein MreC [Anaerolineae bacterium]|nr:rod shape-determining protein MreC [Anaerolineae bacterium]
MKQSPRRPWLPLMLVIIGLFLLVLREVGYLSPVESVFGYVLDPLQRLFASVTTDVGNMFQSVREARELRAEVDALQAEADTLMVENIRLKEYKAEVEQLRAMLSFVSEYPVSAYVGADVVGRDACDTFPCGEVIGVDPNPYLRYITVNVGSQHGVDAGDPVVGAGAGLVGRVAEVGPRTSKVQLLTDNDSSAAVLLQNSRVTGLVVGQPDGTLRMKYIPQDEESEVGDIVLTSGLGGVMPKGLVVGQVAKVEGMDYELHKEAVVEPAIDFRRLELVLVITSFEPVPLDEEMPAETPTPEATPAGP